MLRATIKRRLKSTNNKYMWHIYRSGKLFEFACVIRGKYICGSRQGYARKATMQKVMFKATGASTIQDDTGKAPVIGYLDSDGVMHLTGARTAKPYKP